MLTEIIGSPDSGWILSHHNAFSPQDNFGYPGNYPDLTYLDAVGSPDGRPAGAALKTRGFFIKHELRHLRLGILQVPRYISCDA